MATLSLDAQLREEMRLWDAAGLRRRLETPSGRDFTSNDYLNLSHDPRVVAAARKALEDWGAGSGAARLLRGNLPVHEQAERAVAEWQGTEAALLLPSGWQANLAVLTTLAGKGDALFSDALNHASLIDGSRLSRSRVQVFRHADPGDLERLLRSAGGARRRVIVTESVFSMDGDLAPLAAYEELAERYDAWLVVDEAHGAGMFGPQGAGLCAETGIGARVLARVVTGGKALGVCGAFVAASEQAVETLINRGRAFVFTTAPAPATAAALLAAVAVVRAEPERRRRALAAAERLRRALAEAGIEVHGSGPIVPVVLGGEDRAMRVAARVQAAGFDVRAVRPPTVPAGTSRLRLVCHTDHGDEEIDGLARSVAAAVQAEPAAAPDRSESSRPSTGLPLVVAGTDTSVGKTVVAALLVRETLRRGVDACYLKPVQTGADSDTAEVRRLTGLDAGRAADPIVSLPLPASVDQAADAAGTQVRVQTVLESVQRRLAGSVSARWIVETAGGLLVPFNQGEDQADLLVGLGLPLVLVARSGLGTLNHTRLSLEAAAARGLEVRGLFLVGEPHAANAATLRGWLAPLPVFEVPRFPDLGPVALDKWLDENTLVDLA